MNNQKGFTAAEALLVVLLVSVIGIAVYVAYAGYKKTPAAAKASPSVSASASPKTSYLEIKEWGVKVPELPAGNTLSYRISGITADVVSSEQKALGGQCGTYAFARYHVTKEPNGTYSSDDIAANQMKDAGRLGQAVKIGSYTYYILLDMSGGVCNEDKPTGGPALSADEAKANMDLLDDLKAMVAD